MATRSPGLLPLLLLLLLALSPGRAAAEPLLPPGAFPLLDEAMAAQARQFDAVNAAPFGLSLDAVPRDAAALDCIGRFVAQSEQPELEAFCGAHVYALLADYGEHGDLGMFGGVAAAFTAYRYLALKAEGAPVALLDPAREAVVRAIEAAHVTVAVTGVPGVVARGIRRILPEAGEPPLPGLLPELVPLADAQGQPLPPTKDNGSWRADNSQGELPAGSWIWVDSCSKDQLDGYAFGLAALYDAAAGDPTIDPALVLRMQDDARAIGQALMTPRELVTISGRRALFDLVIPDADGRPTLFSDLHPLSLGPGLYQDPAGARLFNTFNALLALGIVRALWHVSGDPQLEAFLYDELLGRRRYHERLLDGPERGALPFVYFGSKTNYSNVNMMAVALWQQAYLESDEALAAGVRLFAEERWWDVPDTSRSAVRSRQPLYHALYLGLTDHGSSPALIAELADLLGGFPVGPYRDRAVLNCDEAELAAGRCLAIDGVTELTLETGGNRGDRPVATAALHPSIRPPSNFDARSDPFDVNGGGSLQLNPGGDLLAAYWLARFLPQLPPGQAHRSPLARAHRLVPPAGGGGEDAGLPDAGAPDLGPDDGGGPGVDVGPDPDLGGPPADAGPQLDDLGPGVGDCHADDAGSIGPDLGAAADATAAGADLGRAVSDQGTAADLGGDATAPTAALDEDGGCSCALPSGRLPGGSSTLLLLGLLLALHRRAARRA